MNVYYVAESFADAMEKFRFAPVIVAVESISITHFALFTIYYNEIPNRLWVAQNLERPTTQIKYDAQAILTVE